MPHVKTSPKLATSPQAAKPRVKLSWEKFATVVDDMARLLPTHWEEVDVFHAEAPLKPDWERYREFEKAGLLYIMTARVGATLVGYLTVLAYPHLHHKETKWATVDVMWLHPEYRKGWTGVRMIKHLEKGMQKIGARIVWFAVKKHFKNKNARGVGELLAFLGYGEVETVYAKVLK